MLQQLNPLGCTARSPPDAARKPMPTTANVLAARELAAGNLVADALGHRDPNIGLRVLLRCAGAGRGGSLAVVLAGFGDAEALLRVVPCLDGDWPHEGGGERGGDGD